jgi:hypothetical protein
LERAIAKSKGEEFSSLLHELGADYSANAYGANVRSVLTQIDPESVQRLPKRRVERPAPTKSVATPAKKSREKSSKTSESSESDATSDPEPRSKGKPDKATAKKKDSASVAASSAQSGEKSKKKPVADSADAKGDKARRVESPKKKSTSEGLSKRKPR